MPKPIKEDNGSGMHTHISIWDKGKPLFAGNGYAGLSDMCLYFIGGVIKHAKALNAFTNPTTNSYKRLVPGYEAPVLLAYSARNRSASCRIPYGAGDKAKRVEFRFPDAMANPYLCYAALLMAGLDGIENKIHPGEAMDKNLYDLPPGRTGPGADRLRFAARSAGKPRSRPRLPAEGRRVHQGPDRSLYRTQDGTRSVFPLGNDAVAGRVRHVLTARTERIITFALATQETVTRDGVAVRVNAVLWYSAVDPVAVVTAVENWQAAVIQAAETGMRDATGQSDLDQMLKDRTTINERLLKLLAETCRRWGVAVDAVEIKDLDIPEQMQRAIAREAEAIREKRARIIKAEGEQEAARTLADAARTIGEAPGALELRRLQTLTEIGAEHNSTIIAMFPTELLQAAQAIGKSRE
jgi:regulator of protease activity HflC (stomatin/prohibitin superfamily)